MKKVGTNDRNHFAFTMWLLRGKVVIEIQCPVFLTTTCWTGVLYHCYTNQQPEQNTNV